MSLTARGIYERVGRPTARPTRNEHSRCYDPIKASIFRGGRLALILSPNSFCFLFHAARLLLWTTVLDVSETWARIIWHIHLSMPFTFWSCFYFGYKFTTRFISKKKRQSNLTFFYHFPYFSIICDIICGARIYKTGLKYKITMTHVAMPQAFWRSAAIINCNTIVLHTKHRISANRLKGLGEERLNAVGN